MSLLGGEFFKWANTVVGLISKTRPISLDAGSIHGHLYDVLMSTRPIAVIAILKLKPLVTVLASILLVSRFSFPVLNNIDRLMTMLTCSP